MKEVAHVPARAKEGELMPPVYDACLRAAQALVARAVLDGIAITGGNPSNIKVQILIGRAQERMAEILGPDWVDWPPSPDAPQLNLEFGIRPEGRVAAGPFRQPSIMGSSS
jgi:hypothetical protein